MRLDEDISIALQHYLEAEVQRRKPANPVTPADFLEMLLSSDAGFGIPIDRDYLTRIAQVAHERHTARRVDRDAPTLTIDPKLLTKRQMSEILGDRLNYVLVFGAESIYFQDTVHALALDGRRHGGVNVLGVHINWISHDGRSVKRALIEDENGLVKEMAFAEPVPVHVVQILHLPLKNERRIHRELSRRFCDSGILQINPYAASDRADNKAQTHALLEQCEQEIASPKYALIKQGSPSSEIIKRLKSLVEDTQSHELVVQPNRGTEGRKVEKFDGGNLSQIVEYIKAQILPEDDAIVREKRGNVRYKDRLLNVAFRVNVAWNGSEFAAESGYAQIAKDEMTFAASRGRGGEIVDINEALSELYCFRDGKWVRFIPMGEDVAAIKDAAIKAAHALNAGLEADDYLKLMGIDILLEVDRAGHLTPVVLEANPRPAGLSHSSEIMGISSRKPQPRVSLEVFRFLSSYQFHK